MKIITKDEKKLEQERKEKIRQIQEDNKRIEYFEGLKNNRHFQKFVIEEIIDKEISDAEKPTFSSIDKLLAASAEEVKNISITKSANVLLLKKIKSKLMGN